MKGSTRKARKTGLPFVELTKKSAALGIEVKRFAMAILALVERSKKFDGTMIRSRVFLKTKHKKDVSSVVLRKIEEMTEVFSQVEIFTMDIEPRGYLKK